jgi:hypothetical protein
MAKQEKQEPVLREMEPKVIKRIESPTPLPRENTIKQMPKKKQNGYLLIRNVIQQIQLLDYLIN